MIYIKQPIYDEASLSSKANMLLSWIPGAKVWLQQAIADEGLSYNFSSENMLLNSVLSGLYSSENLYLKHCDFSAAPDYLLSLSGEQLGVINGCITADTAEAKARLQQLCQQLGIVTGELNLQLQQLLSEWNINNSFTRSSFSLEDSCALLSLQQQIKKGSYNSVVVKSAADFAHHQSVDARSFALYMAYALSVYQVLFSASKSKTITGAIKSQFMQIYQNIQPWVMQHLACPQLMPPQTATHVEPVIKQWANQQRFIGFTDLATGMKLVALGTDISQLENTSGAQAQLKLFQQQVFSCVLQAGVAQQQLSQDARNWFYHLQYQQQKACFVLAEDGCLTLNHFSSSE